MSADESDDSTYTLGDFLKSKTSASSGSSNGTQTPSGNNSSEESSPQNDNKNAGE